ncbi:cache domain-containing sensor histidine kinase [Paenibacillus herberti]|uniref:HAMP domain-containing protein n=1 Tax=Paenibacillus herberti TaxID=1619309 RepID=A0A229P608_9BACL|nr:sensor histidine kinase [Paenibacillus herberti]OXM17279.1 hypothetical protein CGZ75_11935 [Paenibacillus herberti]
MRRLMPQTLRWRLFFSFLLLVILPIIGTSFFVFQRFESVLRDQVNAQNLRQMTSVTESMESLLSVAVKTFTLLEQDSVVSNILKRPEEKSSYASLMQTRIMEEKFSSINNSVFIASSYVYFTVLDQRGQIYSSYGPSRALNYTDIKHDKTMDEAFKGSDKLTWRLEKGGVNSLYGISVPHLAMYKSLRDGNNQIYAVVRIAADYSSLFRLASINTEPGSRYELVTGEGSILISTAKGGAAEAASWDTTQWEPSGSRQQDEMMVSYSVVPSLGWYLVKSVPTNKLFAEINGIKQSLLLAMLTIMVLFVLMTFFISDTITKPLRLLRKKMSHMANLNLKVKLPPENFHGEMEVFVKGFNLMVTDMEGLISRLKQEERQKESMRFQALLSQMNPHFLLNTLNTVKWLALGLGDKQIPAACESLGKLVEAGIRLDVDLIHLEHELQLVEHYLFIQQLKYDQAIRYEVELPESLKYALVPKLSLQPLVENSIYHGFAGLNVQGVITIRVSQLREQIVIQVEDDGRGIDAQPPSDSHKGQGIALQNLRERLSLLFPGKSLLKLEPLAQGTRVTIMVPLLISNPYANGGELYVDGIVG